MKIVIDIPEIAYEAYKEWHKNKVASVEQSLIANGTPYEERPQGKWIDHSDDYGYVECPVCHELTTCSDNADELHYCWSCGARLGKGGAE
jgi:ribosomal protein S27E